MLSRWIYGNWKMPFRMMDAADDGGAGGSGDGGSGGEGSVEEIKGLSFDDFLKDPKNRAEFDRRVSKSLETAKGKWETEKNTAIENAKLEAEKLAQMTAEQKAEHERQKFAKQLEDREKAVTIRELKAEALSILAGKGMPSSLADVLDYTDAEKCKASIEAVETAFQQSVEASVNEKLKGKPPKAGGGSIDYDKMTDSEYYSTVMKKG